MREKHTARLRLVNLDDFAKNAHESLTFDGLEILILFLEVGLDKVFVQTVSVYR
jgi:hypothetical protein